MGGAAATASARELRRQQAHRASHRRKEDAFHQKLPQQMPAARADRNPYRDFFGASRGARYQQVGDIGACNEQHDARDHQQNHPIRL